jgi:myo-inositol-1(or 4)-monophosphatase
MPTSSEAFIPFAHELAMASGDFIRPFYFQPELTVDSKSDASPVTQADRGAEELMRGIIEKRFPAHGIIGEEFGNVREEAEWVWVLDPIDGTVSFISGCPLFGTLIGLLHYGEPVLGLIHQPILRQLCLGTGEWTEMNGKRVRVRETVSLREATLLSTDLRLIDQYENAKGFQRLRDQVLRFRTWGDCYGYLLLASGFADIMTDAQLKVYDVMPLVPVVRGAGAIITDWRGGPVGEGKSCLAASRSLHASALEMLADG